MGRRVINIICEKCWYRESVNSKLDGREVSTESEVDIRKDRDLYRKEEGFLWVGIMLGLGGRGSYIEGQRYEIAKEGVDIETEREVYIERRGMVGEVENGIYIERGREIY